MEVRVEGVAYSYAEENILKDVTFTAKTGTITGIIGPNGSGKSTLLRTIGKILKPSEGRIFLDDTNINFFSRKEFAQKVAAVGQQDSIYFSYTVEEIVSMGRAPYLRLMASETKEDKKIVNEAMIITGVIDFKDRSIMELSSGERQRVFIARALAQKPEVLMLDEPTSHLDINFQMEICKLARKLADSGITVLLVLHDLNLASRVCDRIAILSSGKIVAEGDVWEVMTSENIKEVYDVDTIIKPSPIGNYPTIFAL